MIVQVNNLKEEDTMRKIGINYEKMGDWTEEDYIKKASELGFNTFFSSARTMEEHARIANALAKYGMEYENVHGPFDHINDIWFETESGDAMYKELVDCIDQCAEVKAKAMVTHLSSGMQPPAISNVGQERFYNLVDYATRKNVKIAFENQRTLANLAWAMGTFEHTDTVGFCWDCGHESCATPGREFMPLYGDRLICTHIHDNEGIFNKDSHLIPFDGVINYERFAQHIRNSGYQGPLTLEIVAKYSDRYDDMTPDEYLERAAIAIKKIAKMVDA